tara:strand:+ start:356 stop:619 length:264 start_codon:yes stop_codon:yes gene_type:complete
MDKKACILKNNINVYTSSPPNPGKIIDTISCAKKYCNKAISRKIKKIILKRLLNNSLRFFISFSLKNFIKIGVTAEFNAPVETARII